MDAGILTQIAAIEKECFSDPWSEKIIAETAGSENHVFSCVKDESGYVFGYGFAQLSGDQGEIERIAVREPFRRNGYGRQILDNLLFSLKMNDIREVFLEVRIHNERAVSLYKKTGFEAAGTRKSYYDDSEDALIMKLSY